jgi:hypothetical protein
MLDCALAEPESGIPEEQSLGEYGGSQAISCVDTNLALDQGKPRCIPPIFLDFFKHYLYDMLDYPSELSLRYPGTIVASWLSF